MNDHETGERQLRVKDLVKRLVKINSKDTVEIQNWIKLAKLILALNAESFNLPDSGNQWETVTKPDGTFEYVVLYLQGLPPDAALDMLHKEILPVIRRNLGTPKQHISEKKPDPSVEKRTKKYSLWAHPDDTDFKYLKSVEQKWEVGGFLLGPIWILLKGGPILLALLVLIAAFAPILIFGINIFSVGWAALIWTVNARCHAGLQAVKLKSLQYKRVADVNAASHEDAQAQLRQTR